MERTINYATRTILVIFSLLLANHSIASGVSPSLDMDKLSPNYDDAVTCGNWKYHSSSGYYRILSAWNGKLTELYFQWISVDKSGKRELVATKRLSELEKIGVDSFVCKDTPSPAMVRILTDEIEFIGAQFVNVFLKNKPGDYEYKGFEDL